MRAFDPEVAAGERLDHRVLDVELVDDLAEQLLDEVLEGDEPGGAAVLVDHDGHVELLALHLAQQLGHALGLGHEARPGRASSPTGCVLVAVALGAHQVLGVHDADDVVDALAAHRDAAVAVEDDDLHGVGDAEVGRHGDHVGAGHHHLADDGVAELDDRLDELALLGLDHRVLHGEVGHGEQLLLARCTGPRFRPLPGQQHVGEPDEAAREQPQRAPAGQRLDRPGGRPARRGRCAGWPRSWAPPRRPRRTA